MSKKDAEKTIINYFSKLTGKKYVLITNSCRTALYLAYKAVGATGEVITSPLTCKVAIDPIIESGNVPVYADIEIGTLNIRANDIEHRITPACKYLQVIHLGGISCDMDEIMKIAEKHNLHVIEDCAQSLGAKFEGGYTGSFGDIACFSLIKNAYGIGGGIFATNNIEYYKRASLEAENFRNTSKLLTWFRIVRNLSESKRNTVWGAFLYNRIIRLKGNHKNYSSVHNQLCTPSLIAIRISAIQLIKGASLRSKRIMLGNQYMDMLKREGLITQNIDVYGDSSFTKFFIYNPAINSRSLLRRLHNVGIEVMHLEQSASCYYQDKIVNDSLFSIDLPNYFAVHDCLISLPIVEGYNQKDLKDIVSKLKMNLNGD
jgi:dTDP-4-amino-4,6-dideoxygalactose transaminase